MRSTVFNLVSTCLGSGMLALPATLAKLGLAGGLFMLVLVPWLGERTTALMVVATELTGGETYTVVAERTLGRAGSVVTAAALIALNYGVCVSYLIVVKDLLPWELKVVLGVDVSGTLCLAAVAVAVLVPLSAMEKMDQLRYASVASVALTYAFVALVTYAGVSTFLRLSADEAAAWWSQQLFRGGAGDWLEAVPVVCFSYLCTQNVPYLFLELRRQSSWNSPSRYVSKRVKFQSSARVATLIARCLHRRYVAAGRMNMMSAPQVDPISWKTRPRSSTMTARTTAAATSSTLSAQRCGAVAVASRKARVWSEPRSPNEIDGKVVTITRTNAIRST